jgi:membrane-bound ClpP family serine protease
MSRGSAQASVAEGITDAVVFSILLFLALWILSLIFPGFAATFGFGNSLLFALAYFGARVVYTPVKAAVASRLG